MVSSSSKEYSVGVLGGYSFYVGFGDSKGGVVPRTTHLTCQIFYCWTDYGNFLLSKSREYSSMSHSYK